jgi:DNA invertase Pin-like site-specific DNA recombinase
MSTYIYASQEGHGRDTLAEYAKKHCKDAKLVVETSKLMLNWEERSLNDVLAQAKKGDTIVTLDAISLARSHTQVLGFLEACLAKGVNVNFVKYGLTFKAEPTNNFMNLLTLSREIEADFVSKRNMDAINKRQEYGIVLGRPKGRKNKSLKLDKYKKDIMRYLELSISKASIAKLVDCHPQTLYDWIDRNEITDAKPRRTRSNNSEMA